MKAQSLSFAAIVIGSVWFCTPQAVDGPRSRSAEKVALASETGESAASDRVTWGAGLTILERQADGHFYANVVVSGVETQMLVDTGASFIALTAADAEAIGLDWNESDMTVVAHGASGPVRGVPVSLDEVELNGLHVRDVRGAIIPEGLGISLLGQTFLSQIDRVSIEDGQMVLGE
ncbi:TIGR02281 family clan AA aspartic protease [Altererythrobacter aurantiacus]|uniref:TIGR02281 family clan AA aspartic protease n=1 Tax=Parapontixanthobacter aurantiacus TaxID=1463599 RepID=A0A844ZHI8_9SPHN|nr:TIGR02281 family clan AA aspartic protease [Parapontixanthobacter aurantiacus]MXO86430.1 TIGR02281 family clan AA aspartic protease [Parapontixanthobacter aurantiacus]